MDAQDNLKAIELDLKSQELTLRKDELEVKKLEARNHAAEMCNTYLRENRGRADGLVRGLLLITGGALTLSLNAFLREHAIQILPGYVSTLKCAWGLLFAAMVCAILVPLSLIIGARFHGIRWRRHLAEGRPDDELRQPIWSDRFAWTFGLASIAACCGGLVLLARIAIGTLNG